MRANSRSSIRWGVATAVVALALGALPLTFGDDGDAITGTAALAEGGGNGRLVAANPPLPAADGAVAEGEQEQPVSGLADDAGQDLGSADDGDRIGDDSDIASVDISAKDADADAGGGPFGEAF